MLVCLFCLEFDDVSLCTKWKTNLKLQCLDLVRFLGSLTISQRRSTAAGCVPPAVLPPSSRPGPCRPSEILFHERRRCRARTTFFFNLTPPILMSSSWSINHQRSTYRFCLIRSRKATYRTTALLVCHEPNRPN
jgi:hypothetical protein